MIYPDDFLIPLHIFLLILSIFTLIMFVSRIPPRWCSILSEEEWKGESIVGGWCTFIKVYEKNANLVNHKVVEASLL